MCVFVCVRICMCVLVRVSVCNPQVYRDGQIRRWTDRFNMQRLSTVLRVTDKNNENQRSEHARPVCRVFFVSFKVLIIQGLRIVNMLKGSILRSVVPCVFLPGGARPVSLLPEPEMKPTYPDPNTVLGLIFFF